MSDHTDTAETQHPDARSGHLTGRLGVTSIVFMVIAAAAPLTVIGGNVPLAILNGNGAGAPVGFVVASAVMLLFSVGFVAMTPHVERAGAFFAYVERGLGAVAGMGAAFLALVTYTAIQVGVWGYFGGSLSNLVHHYGGPDLPWWVYTGLVLVGVAVLGYHHIDLSAKVLGVALVAEIAIVLLMDGVILGTGGASGISGASFTPDAMFTGAVGIAVLFSLTGFIGFEAAAVYRSEARSPERTIPRATYLAAVIIGLFYTLSSWAMIEGWGAERVSRAAQADPDNLMLDTAGTYLGAAGRDVMQVLLITSLFACVLSFHNVVARYQFTLAGRGVLHRALARVHPRHQSPHVSSVAQSCTAAALLFVFALAGLEPLTEIFSAMAGVATLGIVSLMLLTCLAVLVFFTVHHRADRRLWQTRLAPSLGIASLLGCLWLILSNFDVVVDGTAVLATVVAAVPVAAFALGTLVGVRHRGTTGTAREGTSER
ncbi:amino acid/polyamine/organocation transporter (APC superfamily) [Haloactinospora alba]|uniref:Amino acid/polyamine/organocation transporter (APC superfamily) n=1 Tax=Haloactinospora alba TaxID=405555 RepID=A0A543NNL3_9ACTN|nr:APC family permease [Haloactinospora alba]TQN33428.1 amino acid/polyamine/organocation transporter (APC superfamily) [Haloactinospora alba]